MVKKEVIEKPFAEPFKKRTMLVAETDFGLEMLRQTPVTQSCVISPISILLGLTMVQLGSRGRTKAQINNAIVKAAADDGIFNYFSNLSTELNRDNAAVCSRIASGLFISDKYCLKQDYRRSVENKLAANVEELDFDNVQASAKAVNDFVRDNTGGKIIDLVRASSFQDATAFIVNAIYFRGIWEHKFPKKRTAKAEFFSAEDKVKQIDFMRTKGRRAYAEDDDVQVLSLKYTNPSYAMNIFLPKKRFGLDDLLTNIDGKRVQKLLSQLKQRNSISISIPKLKLETNLDLKQALVSMGITDLFSSNADLSGIADSEHNLRVSDATHKAVIEMEEEATTAAAATAFKLTYKSLARRVHFIADHPFLFVLTKSGHPLFMGKFTNE